jgi:hypothetical protein
MAPEPPEATAFSASRFNAPARNTSISSSIRIRRCRHCSDLGMEDTASAQGSTKPGDDDPARPNPIKVADPAESSPVASSNSQQTGTSAFHSINRAVWGSAPLALVAAFFLVGLVDPDTVRARILFAIAWAIGTLAVVCANWTLEIRPAVATWAVRLVLSILMAGGFYLVDAASVARKE